MAYQMIHMEIAYRLMNKIPDIKNKADFMLGSVAPDSVHMNPEYEVGLKVASHLFEGCGPWSNTQDYERWNKNIFELWNKYWNADITNDKENEEKSFVAGVCVHCLTDYSNDVNIWRRLQKEYVPPMELEEFRASYYPEARGIDQWLYQNSQHREEIRKLLSEGQGFELNGLLRVEDLEKVKGHLLNVQYANAKVDISNYKYLSEERIMEFVENTVDDIEQKILKQMRKE